MNTQAQNQAQIELFFKLTKADKDAGKTEKRPNLIIQYNAIQAQEIPLLPKEQVCTVLNAAIENYARKLVAQNGDNWDYKPESSELTLESVFNDLTAESKRGQRLLSKENLHAYFLAYSNYARTVLEKSENQIQMHESIIKSKLNLIAGKNDMIAVFSGFLTQFDDWISGADSDFSHPQAELIQSVSSKLLEIASSLLDVKLDAAAL